MKKITIIYALLLLFSACESESDNAKIVGNWQGIAWNIQGEPSNRDASQVQFKFESGDQYSAAFGGQKEAGSFRLKGNKLYTTATGKAEKMVELSLKGTDTLVMDMNRVGTLEELVLVRQ